MIGHPGELVAEWTDVITLLEKYFNALIVSCKTCSQ